MAAIIVNVEQLDYCLLHDVTSDSGSGAVAGFHNVQAADSNVFAWDLISQLDVT